VDAKAGNPYVAEPGLIVLPEVTLEYMQKAVRRLAQAGFFESLIPVTDKKLLAMLD
jgi:hypothetical protein